jgi:hypothetical protein
MEILFKDLEGAEVLSIPDFLARKNLSKTPQSIKHHIKLGNLDFCQMGNRKFVVWNEKASHFVSDKTGRKRKEKDNSKKVSNPIYLEVESLNAELEKVPLVNHGKYVSTEPYIKPEADLEIVLTIPALFKNSFNNGKSYK